MSVVHDTFDYFNTPLKQIGAATFLGALTRVASLLPDTMVLVHAVADTCAMIIGVVGVARLIHHGYKHIRLCLRTRFRRR